MRASRNTARPSTMARSRLIVGALIVFVGATITSAAVAGGTGTDEADHPCATRVGEIALCR